MTVLIWVFLVVAVGFLLMIGVERILKHFNIQPERPDDQFHGLRDVFDRVEEWQRDRKSRRQ